jgi:hypothetical protein
MTNGVFLGILTLCKANQHIYNVRGDIFQHGFRCTIASIFGYIFIYFLDIGNILFPFGTQVCRHELRIFCCIRFLVPSTWDLVGGGEG